MALPASIPVKLFSEAAEYVSTERVVTRNFTIHELLEALLAVAGKDVERLRQILRAGSVTVEHYRHRWAPIEAEAADLETALAGFPDARPERAFERERCVFATIRAGVETIELPREQAARRRLLQK